MFVALKSWYRKQRIKFAIKLYNWVMPELNRQEVDDVFIYRLTREKTFKKLVPIAVRETSKDNKLLHYPPISDVVPPSQVLPSTDKKAVADKDRNLLVEE